MTLRPWLQVVQKVLGTSSRGHLRRRRQTLPCAAEMETLEVRQVPAAAMNGSFLEIKGSETIADNAKVETVTVSGVAKTRVTLNGVVKDFSGVTQIKFWGYGENDTFVNQTSIASNAEGGAGRDVLRGGKGNDVLDGGIGDDKIWGGGGDDNIEGRGGDDSLYGQQGNDTLSGGEDADVIFGGDSVPGADGADTIYGDAGNDILDGGDGNDLIKGGIDDDKIEGRGGNDTVLGQAGNDTLSGGKENDVIYGGDSVFGDDGADTIYGDAGNDNLDGGDGNDLIRGGLDNDNIEGRLGNDTLLGQGGNDTLSGRDGADVVYGGDTARGDDGADTLYGDAGNDLLDGGLGNDLIRGGAEDDQVEGRSGNDALYGEQGNDTLSGGAQNDLIYGGDGNDAVYGDAGNDWLEAGSATELAIGGSGDRDWNAHVWAIANNSGDPTARDDIHQRESNTCVFLSTLAAVGDRTNLESRINYLGNFMYQINLWWSPTPSIPETAALTPVIVSFNGNLVTDARGQLLDPKPAVEGEAWVVLYQRAYLQQFWNLGANAAHIASFDGELNGNLASFALTGRLGQSSPINSWTRDDLMAALNSGNAVTACSLSSSKLVLDSATGIIGDHCYIVVGVTPTADNNFLVTLRNPWGHDTKDANTGRFFSLDGSDDALVTMTWNQFRSDFALFTFATV